MYYNRILEELTGYLSPENAREVLSDSFWSCGVPPDEAIAYDVRTIGLEVLPDRLRGYLSPSDHHHHSASDGAGHDEVLDRLELMLMDMHRPPTIPPAKCGEPPARHSTSDTHAGRELTGS